MKKDWLGNLYGAGRILLTAVLMILLTACQGALDDQDNIFNIYYIDKEGTGLVSEKYEIETEEKNTVDIIQLLLAKLQTNGSEGRYQNPVQPDVEIRDFLIKETQPAVDSVEFYVEDQPLTLAGNTVGLMDVNTFVDQLNPEFKEQKKLVTLYFAENRGHKLMQVSLEVTYSAAQPLAQLLLEKLIEGPEQIEHLKDMDYYGLTRTVPSGTVVNSVTIRDNICYVDLGSEFMNQIPEVKSDVTIYSIVNTLCELSNVSKVQFTVEGEQWTKYGETENFNTPYARNLDLVTGGTSIWVNP